MPTTVTVGKITEALSSVVVVRWFKAEGEEVRAEESLCELETDKANVEVVAPITGVVGKILVPAKGEAAVGQVLAVLLAEGETLADIDLAKAAAPPSPDLPPWLQDTALPTAAFALTPQAAPEVEEVPLSLTRKVIAERLASSARSTVATPLFLDIDLGPLLQVRKEAAKRFGDLSLTAFLVRAVAELLLRHPALNASFADTYLRVFRYVNMGIALDAPDGLVVPVIQRAESKSIVQLNEAIKRLTQMAQTKTLRPEDLRDGTFTISNLGLEGVDAFIPVINPPQSAILGIGRMRPRPVVVEGKVEVRQLATFCLNFDHRAVDGAPAARFLRDLRERLEREVAEVPLE